MPNTPLAVLDLVPISSGATAADALRNSIDLAQRAERPGLRALLVRRAPPQPRRGRHVARRGDRADRRGHQSTIRIGSGAVQIGHRTALSTVEEFGLIDALHPGRLDLGLGRSGRQAARPGS